MRAPFVRAAIHLLAAVFVWIGMPRAGAAQLDSEPALRSVREHVLYARYRDAISESESLLGRTDLGARTRVQALELLATAQIASRRVDDSERTLRVLYARDPEHRLSDPDASPPVLSAFSRAREARPTPLQPLARLETPPLTRRTSPRLEVEISEGADAVEEVRLFYRTNDEPHYAQLVMSRTETGNASTRYAGFLPLIGVPDQPTEFSYYVALLAPSGAVLSRIGTPEQPRTLNVPAADIPDPSNRALSRVPAPPPDQNRTIADDPVFWIVLGLVVLGGGAAGLAIGLTSGPSGPEQGTLGSVTLQR